MVSRFRKWFETQLDGYILFGSAVLIVPCIVFGIASPALFKAVSDVLLHWIVTYCGWLYLSSVSIFVAVCLLIALSPLGAIRLGKPGEPPEFSRLSWFAMLFSAGMGIGLVFWSIAEPLYHFSSPPVGQPNSPESARLAFSIFFYHWGIHAWGTYVAVGLPLAFFQFRRNQPCLISSCIRPLFGTSDGGIRRSPDSAPKAMLLRLIDALAVYATILGVVTSLGLGAMQISSGLSLSYGIPTGNATTVWVIVVITLLFIASAASGVNKGIKYLSLLNVLLMLLLLAFFFVFGHFGYIAGTFGQALGDYLQSIVPLSLSLTLFGNREWTGSWTIFYWAWWIAWAPFVGAFIAHISKGRTIREFVLMVMIVPAMFSFLFSSALGGTAVYQVIVEHLPLVATVGKSIEATLFAVLANLPMYGLTAILANLLIASFFITSADSATMVICQFTTSGAAPTGKRAYKLLVLFWGTVLGGLALVLVVSGGLKALQTASIIGALPFVVIMYCLLYTLVRELLREKALGAS